jgi:hypothetical protein
MLRLATAPVSSELATRLRRRHAGPSLPQDMNQRQSAPKSPRRRAMPTRSLPDRKATPRTMDGCGGIWVFHSAAHRGPLGRELPTSPKRIVCEAARRQALWSGASRREAKRKRGSVDSLRKTIRGGDVGGDRPRTNPSLFSSEGVKTQMPRRSRGSRGIALRLMAASSCHARRHWNSTSYRTAAGS